MCNSMDSTEIWDKHHEFYNGNGKNFMKQSAVKFPLSNQTKGVFILNFTAILMLFQVVHSLIPCSPTFVSTAMHINITMYKLYDHNMCYTN